MALRSLDIVRLSNCNNPNNIYKPKHARKGKDVFIMKILGALKQISLSLCVFKFLNWILECMLNSNFIISNNLKLQNVTLFFTIVRRRPWQGYLYFNKIPPCLLSPCSEVLHFKARGQTTIHRKLDKATCITLLGNAFAYNTHRYGLNLYFIIQAVWEMLPYIVFHNSYTFTYWMKYIHREWHWIRTYKQNRIVFFVQNKSAITTHHANNHSVSSRTESTSTTN